MKKVFAFLMVVVMVAAMFAGCANPAGKSGAIKVGTSGPLTGAYAVYGVAVANGLKLAFDEINAMGGLQFEVMVQDDEAGADTAVNAYNALMDWGMQIMAGPTTSGSAAAVAAECVNDKVFMLTPSASDPSVIAAGDNIFQVCFSDTNQGKASADYIFENKVATNVGVIYDSSSSYSTGIYSTFQAQADVLGLTVGAVEAFTADNAADLTTQVTKCKEAGCDMIFLPLYTAENARVISCADKIGYDVKFFGCDGMDGVLDVEGFDKALAEGVMLLTPFDATATDDKTQNFVKNYTEKFQVAPNQFAADAYDAGYAIYEACKAMNITSNMDAADICAKMVEYFTTKSFDGLTGKGMTWGTDGAVSKYPMAVIIKDGVYVTP